MNPNRIVVIGGVAGGATAAAKARRTDENAVITVFERGPYISFANCGLPYYVGGVIKDRDALLLHTPDSFYSRYRITAKVLHEAVAINRIAKTVTVRDLAAGREFTQEYDKLILAPGAKAFIPDVPGVKLAGVFTLRTVPDADAIIEYIRKEKPARAVIAGAGFIGLEAAEAFMARGIKTTVVELSGQALPSFDADMAAYVAEHLKDSGAELLLGQAVAEFYGAGRLEGVKLSGGERLPADIAVIAAGVKPDSGLAARAGLELGAGGAVKVDDRMRTSDPDIYAAGDAVETLHLVTGKKAAIPLAGPANKQGRIAGANAAGADMRFPGALGTAIVSVLGVTAGKTGLSEKEAKAAGLDCKTVITHDRHHAGYYPGSVMLHIKLVVESPSGRLLGAQVVGGEGVDKRVDVFATAISAGMTAAQIANLDLAYAPQFSSAKDPVIVAAMLAENLLSGRTALVSPEELAGVKQSGREFQLLDVRTRSEHKSCCLEGSQNIPVDELRDRACSLDRNKETFIYCRVGLRGYLAELILKARGFAKVKNLMGGIFHLKSGKLR